MGSRLWVEKRPEGVWERRVKGEIRRYIIPVKIAEKNLHFPGRQFVIIISVLPWHCLVKIMASWDFYCKNSGWKSIMTSFSRKIHLRISFYLSLLILKMGIFRIIRTNPQYLNSNALFPTGMCICCLVACAWRGQLRYPVESESQYWGCKGTQILFQSRASK